MKKLFISQPMRDKTNEEIIEERNRIKKIVEEKFNEPVELIDSFFKDAPHNATPIWYLGQSLLKLSEANVAYFAKKWEKYDGCIIEHETAVRYSKRDNINLDIIEE